MRAEKELLKQEMTDKFGRFGSFVVMQYQGLGANAANEFRREIRKLGGDIEVMRKRVLLKAALDAGISLDVSLLPGHVGIVFLGEDPIEGTKTVIKFGLDRENKVQVIGGRFDGRLYSAADVALLSTLPNRDGMRAQLLSVLEAPLSQTLAVIEAVLTSIPYCLDNKCKQSGDVQEEDVQAESV